MLYAQLQRRALRLRLGRPDGLVPDLGDLSFDRVQPLLNLLDLQPLIGAVTAQDAARLGQRFFELFSFGFEIPFQIVEPSLILCNVGLHLTDAAGRSEHQEWNCDQTRSNGWALPGDTP